MACPNRAIKLCTTNTHFFHPQQHLFVLQKPVSDTFLIDDAGICSLAMWSSVEESTCMSQKNRTLEFNGDRNPPVSSATQQVHGRISLSRVRIIFVLTIFEFTNGTKYTLPDQTAISTRA